MRILLATYSAETHSSYGKVTRELWRRLRSLHPDWEIIQHGWLHRSDESVNWPIEETKKVQTAKGLVPMVEDKFGQLSFEGVVAQVRPDIVWTLSDPFMCDYMGQYRPRYKFRLVKHIPFDGAPLPTAWIDALRDTDLLIPITDFGCRVVEPHLGYKPKFIYHGVNTDMFQPGVKSERNRPTTAKVTEKTFLLGYVGHSQWRKQNWNMFALTRYLRDGAWILCKDCDRVTLDEFDDIWSRFGLKRERCWYCKGDRIERPGPQDVGLWYHTFDRANIDFQPTKMKALWDLDGNVIFTNGMQADAGIPDRDMPTLFRCFDAYLSLSGGEGFCIPIIEAFASGIPVVYTDYSGQAEVGAHAGLPVRYTTLQPNTVEPVNRAIADVADAVRQVWRLMSEPKVVESCVHRGLVAARDTFSWDVIASQWSRALESDVSVRRKQSIGVTL